MGQEHPIHAGRGGGGHAALSSCSFDHRPILTFDTFDASRLDRPCGGPLSWSMLSSFTPDPREAQRRLTRRRFLQGASAAGVLMAAYGGTHGRHELDYVRRTVALRNLPEAFRGFRIVQISDIHLEDFTEPWFPAAGGGGASTVCSRTWCC